MNLKKSLRHRVFAPLANGSEAAPITSERGFVIDPAAQPQPDIGFKYIVAGSIRCAAAQAPPNNSRNDRPCSFIPKSIRSR